MYLIIYVEALKSSINGENIAVTFFCFRYCFGCKNILLPSRHLYERGEGSTDCQNGGHIGKGTDYYVDNYPFNNNNMISLRPCGAKEVQQP